MQELRRRRAVGHRRAGARGRGLGALTMALDQLLTLDKLIVYLFSLVFSAGIFYALRP